MFGVLTGTTRRAGGTQGRRAFRGLFSPKRGNKNFYKGYGARSLGESDSKGRFHINPAKVPEIMVPDLTGCTLKPYVDYSVPKVIVAPFKAPIIDMAQCEVDIKNLLYPQRKTATGAKSKGKKSSAEVTDAPAIEAPASL